MLLDDCDRSTGLPTGRPETAILRIASPNSRRCRRCGIPLTDPIKQTLTLDLLEHGLVSAHVATALQRFRRLIDTMPARLVTAKWLAGDAYSLADADLTPYMSRPDELGVATLWPAKRRGLGVPHPCPYKLRDRECRLADRRRPRSHFQKRWVVAAADLLPTLGQ